MDSRVSGREIFLWWLILTLIQFGLLFVDNRIYTPLWLLTLAACPLSLAMLGPVSVRLISDNDNDPGALGVYGLTVLCAIWYCCPMLLAVIYCIK
jgi:hypothetical protein